MKSLQHLQSAVACSAVIGVDHPRQCFGHLSCVARLCVQMILIPLVVILLTSFSVTTVRSSSVERLQPTDLVYQGAFRLPNNFNWGAPGKGEANAAVVHVWTLQSTPSTSTALPGAWMLLLDE